MGRVHDGPELSDSPELSEYKAKAAESVNQHLAEFCLVLKAAHIDEVHVIYGAGEDDGGIEEINFFRRVKGKLVATTAPDIPKRYDAQLGENAFDDMMYNIMQARGYFDQNEGCQGTIRWQIDRDVMIHDHQTNSYGEGEETGEEWTDTDGTTHKEKETLYIPEPVETYYGIDDLVSYRGNTR